MTRTLLLPILFVAGVAHADATLFILRGGAGQSFVAGSSLVVTSGADGSIDLYDLEQSPPSPATEPMPPEIPGPAAGHWTWRIHSKSGTQSGAGVCTGHTEQRTGSDGGGVFVWLDCELQSADR